MRVRVLRRAQRDLDELDAWLEREQPAERERVLGVLLDGLARLGRFPKPGPLAKDPVLRRRGYRTLARGRQVVFYRVERSSVLVLRVLHERRSWRQEL